MRRPGTGLVLAVGATFVVVLAVSALVAAVVPAAPATHATGSTGTPAESGTRTEPPSTTRAGTTEAGTRTFTSKTGRFSVALPDSYTVQQDLEGDNGLVFFAATAGDGFGDFKAEGVTIMLVPVKPGSSTSPGNAGDLWNTLNGLSNNPTRCTASGGFTQPGGKAITPPEGVTEHQDWQWNGCPNGGIERDFAYFEPTGHYGVVIAARSQDPDTAKALVTQAMDSFELTR